MHVYLEVSPTRFNGAFSEVNVHRSTPLFTELALIAIDSCVPETSHMCSITPKVFELFRSSFIGVHTVITTHNAP